MSSDESSYDLYRRGREQMEAKNFLEAIALFEQSVAQSPHFKTLELLGECYLQQNEFMAAIVPLAAATALNDQGRAPALLADAFYQLNETHDAQRFAQLALERNKNNKLAQKIFTLTQS